jgi:transcriptional regulator with XRE-family HTH domain
MPKPPRMAGRAPAKSPPLRVLGDAMRAARLERGHTQQAFAAHARIDRAYYGAVERGQFNLALETLQRIATGLDLTASELLARAKL